MTGESETYTPAQVAIMLRVYLELHRDMQHLSEISDPVPRAWGPHAGVIEMHKENIMRRYETDIPRSVRQELNAPNKEDVFRLF